MAATQQLRSPPGAAVTTTLATIYTNSSSGADLSREIVQVTFNSIDSVNDAALSACTWVDASASSASLQILPLNVKVAKADSLTVTKVLDPGDQIRASASANGDIVAIVEIIGREAA